MNDKKIFGTSIEINETGRTLILKTPNGFPDESSDSRRSYVYNSSDDGSKWKLDYIIYEVDPKVFEEYQITLPVLYSFLRKVKRTGVLGEFDVNDVVNETETYDRVERASTIHIDNACLRIYDVIFTTTDDIVDSISIHFRILDRFSSKGAIVQKHIEPNEPWHLGLRALCINGFSEKTEVSKIITFDFYAK